MILTAPYLIEYQKDGKTRRARARTLIEAMVCVKSLNALNAPRVFRRRQEVDVKACLWLLTVLHKENALK